MTLIITQDLQLQTNDPAVQLKKGHIGYQNYVTKDSINVSSEAAGFLGEGLANPLTFERWKPDELPANVVFDFGEPKDVDYIGLASHTFGTDQITYYIQYSTDGVIWEDIGNATAVDNKSIMAIFPAINAQYFRITLEGSGEPPSLGVVYIGLVLTVQRGFYGGHTPITMGRKTKRIMNKTEGGQYAGVSVIREGIQTTISWQHLQADWYRANFEPFVVFARSKPFFFAWRNFEYPSEVGYCWTVQDIIPENMGIRDLMSVSMTVEGFSDE